MYTRTFQTLLLLRVANTSTLSIMSRQVSSILEPLAQAIDRLDLHVDNTVLADAFALADRLTPSSSPPSVNTTWRSCGATTAPRP